MTKGDDYKVNPEWKGRYNLTRLDEEQTIEVDSNTLERRHKDHPDLWVLPQEEAQTIIEGFDRGLKIAGTEGNFIGIPVLGEDGLVTDYKYKTYGQVQTEAKQLAASLQKIDLKPGLDFIGFFSSNNYVYDLGILAGYYRNLANVSLYDTLGEQAVEHICNEAELKLIFVQDIKKLKLLFKSNLRYLKTVVMMEKVDVNDMSPPKDGITVYDFDEFVKLGEGTDLFEIRPKTDDLATLNYTSGTTGNPKGVMLTHNALMTSGIGVGKFMMSGRAPETSDIWYSYLPLAHIFERVAHITFMSFGAQWAYNGGGMTQVVPELAICRPTIFGSVPRVLNKLFDKINAALNEPGCVPTIKRGLIGYCRSKKREYLDEGIVTKDTFWDRKVLGPKLQSKLGGRVHTIVCGAAPLNPDVRGFVRETMGCYFIEGYGQTENAAAGVGTIFANYCQEDGCIGVPCPWTGVKLVDVPEMNYLAQGGKGEICFKGGNLMKGYYKNPEKTAETIDEDGWLHTGDIGMWSENKQLKIIDRKKNIFKLSHGEYIAPERLEGIYAKDPLVQQIFIYGNSNESSLIAVVVPDPDNYEKLKSANPGKDVKKILLTNINNNAKHNDKLKGFEMIRECIIETDPFSIENGLLTPTSKAKRPQLEAKYKSDLEQLYGSI